MSSLSFQSAVASFLDGEVPAQLSAWLATYLVHGVCLFLVAAIAAKVIKSARGTEQLWRAALFGPLVTASLQLGAGFDPAFGHWQLPSASEAAVIEETAAVAPAGGGSYLQELELRERALIMKLAQLSGELEVVLEGGPAAGAAGPVPSAAAPADAPKGRDLGTILALPAVAAGIAALMLRALLEAIRIHRLGTRTRLMSGPVVATVNQLARQAGLRRAIRIEVTAQGSSPYATGVLFPRIIVPKRAIAELDALSMQAMLAHEIGHVARFDPLWTAAARSVAALFFFQPLNWLLVKRLDECAEYCCDEFAVDVTGNEVALARCLTTVAEWIIGGPTSVRAACPMAHRNSPLASRVNRILATEGEPRGPLGPLRWIGGAVVLTTALAAPGFAARTIAPTDAGPEAVVEGARPAPNTRRVTSSPLDAPAPLAPPAPQTVFELLEKSIAQLSSEIDELILIAQGREVPGTTILRLTEMRDRAEFIRRAAHLLVERAQRLSR